MLKIVLTSLWGVVLYANPLIYEAKLTHGFSLRLEDSSPAIIQTTIKHYGNCNILGEGRLRGDRVHINLTEMTCYQNNQFITYKLQDSFIIDKTDNISGLRTKYKVSTNEKLGHWDTKRSQQVLLWLGSQPKAEYTLYEENVIVPSGNYGF